MSRCRRDAAQDVGKERRVRALDGFVALLGQEAQRDELVDDAVEVGRRGPSGRAPARRPCAPRSARSPPAVACPWLRRCLFHERPRQRDEPQARAGRIAALAVAPPRAPSPGPRSRRSGCRCRPAHGGARRPPSARSWRCCRRCRSAMSRRGLRSRARRRRQSGRCPRSPGSVRRRRPAPVPAGSRARRAR